MSYSYEATQKALPQYRKMREIGERVAQMIHRRAVVEYYRAMGYQGRITAEMHLDMCVIHNSLLAQESGTPWREIDYSKMRKCRWLCNKSFEPRALCDAWFERKCYPV